MPLADYVPKLDDRSFEDIMAEVRTRIARYTPEWNPGWTDLNDNDPGIALTQVFAWMSEMLIYRMNLVPELNYFKFLQLLGIELNPAEPAAVEITFPVKEDYADPYTTVPARTQVSAQAANGEAPLIFETESALTALTMRLASLQLFDGYSYTDITDANAEAADGFAPFGKSAAENAALLLGFSSADDFPAKTRLDLAFWSKESGKPGTAYACGPAASAAYASATVCWEYWDGTYWAKLDLLKDDTRAFTRSGHVHLKTPAKGSLQKTALGEETEKLYWIQARLAKNQYERAPQLLAVRTNTVAAVQAETLTDEVLGGSTGERDQVLALSRTPVLKGTLQLEVDEGDGFQAWTEVEDFFGSSPTDRHFVLDRTGGKVRFGDGFTGSIPVKNAANASANVVAREYRVGGGSRGNAAAGAVKTLVSAVEGVDDGAVANLVAASGGRDEETLAEAKKRAPAFVKSRCRAVTAEDFEYFAMRAAEIRRACALPLFHPDFPGTDIPGVVTVIVVPDSDCETPTPSEGTLRTVCAYLEERRLLTTELYVAKPAYQKVEVSAEVVVADSADLGDVKSAVGNSLESYFHALKGGEDGLGWPFGGTISYSRLMARIFSVKGVESIQNMKISLDRVTAEEYQNVPINTGALLYSGEHKIRVSYSDETIGACP
ncbi:MAG: putative baseplate assembly protein [Anaerolineales bacterium]|nr:putative baseplate assembly protein [Anaerolineales bacterium]